MWRCVFLAAALTSLACAQNGPSQFDFANLREDVRALTQRVGELGLKVEQLERENADLRERLSTSATTNERSYVTLTQLNDAVRELGQDLRAAIATSKNETLQHVSTQLEKLAKQTNAALDALARPAATRAPVSFADDFPKEGINYIVQKGDTLAGIAKKTGAKPQDIINANKLDDPSKLLIGQTLVIPGGK